MVAAVLGVQSEKQFWDLPFSAIFLDSAVEGVVVGSVQGLPSHSGLCRRVLPMQLSWEEGHREAGGVG